MENSTLNEYADMQKLNDLKQLIFSLNEENFDLSIQNTMNLFDTKFPYTFNIMISTYVFSAFYSLKNDCDIYLRYLHTLQEKEKELNKDNPKIMKIFTKYISEINIQEAYYLIEKMINKKLINSDVAKDINSNYFMHYKANQYVKNIVNCQFSIKIINNYDKLSNNDFELHKKLIAEGVNPNEISKIIRNDEIEKLQEISSETNFDYNQLIKPSLYERCSFINQDNISLIDFAAFFGAIKCFKFLLLNDAKINETGKYAVAGGNLEIIHLCAQNNSSFEGAYETAIKFHNNEIFRYIYENNLEELDKKAKNKKLNRPRKKVFNIGNQFDLYRNVFVNEDEPDLESDKINQLIRACSFSGNYEILSFLEEKGFDKPNKDIINDIAKIGNLYLIKHFLQKNQPSKDILIYSSQSGNNELIEYMLKQKGIDINAKDCFLYLIFISVI